MTDQPRRSSASYVPSDKEGWLYKHSAGTNLWRKRYVYLDIRRRSLYYFVSDDDCNAWRSSGAAAYKGVIQLHSTVIYPYVDYVPDQKFAFELTTPVRPFLLAAENGNDLQDWVAAFTYACGVTLLTSDCEVYVQGAVLNKVRRGKYGYMNKRGRLVKAYKKRFFRTVEDASGNMVLAYYATPYEVKPLGVVPLQKAKIYNVDLLVTHDATPLQAISTTDSSSSTDTDGTTTPTNTTPTTPTTNNNLNLILFEPSFRPTTTFAASSYYDPTKGLDAMFFSIKDNNDRTLCLETIEVGYILYLFIFI